MNKKIKNVMNKWNGNKKENVHKYILKFIAI